MKNRFPFDNPLPRFRGFFALRLVIVGFLLGTGGCDKKAAVVLEAVDKGIQRLSDKASSPAPPTGDAPPGDAPTITVSIVADLQVLQFDQSAEIEFYPQSGDMKPETLAASAKLQINRNEPTKEVKVVLKAGYAYRYKLDSQTNLVIQKRPVLGTGSNSGAITFTEANKLARLSADTSASSIQPDGRGAFTMQFKPLLEVVSAGSKKYDPKVGTISSESSHGQVMLRSVQPQTKGVTAWVEVDGRRAADWPSEGQELSITTATGNRRIVVRSIYEGKSYKKEFAVQVVPGGVAKLTLGAMDPSSMLVVDPAEETSGKKDTFAEEIAKYESDAASRLNLIRPLVRDPNKKSFAITQLQKLIAACPNTEAAQEAQSLVRQLQK